MRRGYTQGIEAFAREASKLLVNRRSNESGKYRVNGNDEEIVCGGTRFLSLYVIASGAKQSSLSFWLWIASCFRLRSTSYGGQVAPRNDGVCLLRLTARRLAERGLCRSQARDRHAVG